MGNKHVSACSKLQNDRVNVESRLRDHIYSEAESRCCATNFDWESPNSNQQQLAVKACFNARSLLATAPYQQVRERERFRKLDKVTLAIIHVETINLLRQPLWVVWAVPMVTNETVVPGVANRD